MFNTPVLYLIFNRPDVTATTFERLREIKPAKLYIAADGPRTNKEGEAELCKKTREIATQVDWKCEVKTLFREANLGCGKAVSEAITWFFENEEFGIILEDDCLANDAFFTFCDTLLNKYKDDDRVMMVSGTNYIFDNISNEIDYYFCRYYSVWGWATWRRAWNYYQFEIKDWPVKKANRFLNYILPDDQMAEVYSDMFDTIYVKKIDTWDLQWVYTCLVNNGLCATSSTNLIKNIGAAGTHTSADEAAPYTRMPEVRDVKFKTLSEDVNVAVNSVYEEKAFNSLLENFFRPPQRKETLRDKMASVYRKVKRKIKSPAEQNSTISEVVTIQPSIKIKGRALLSYLNTAINADDNSPLFKGHSNKWESREMARLLQKRGYIVDVINWDNTSFIPDQNYDVFIDIAFNLQRLAPFIGKNCKKILHNTGSYWYFAIDAELKRVEELEKRRDCFYTPKRIPLYPELHERSLRLADHCTLIGNATTLATYPEKFRNKFSTLAVSNSETAFTKNKSSFIPVEREFLWFNSFGQVHKGLDLLMEVFLKHPELKLNVIGSKEPDFMKIYENDLKKVSNIKFYDFLDPASKEFEQVLERCFCFLSPSCSEGMSGSSATCLKIGLYPVLSANNGIDLKENCGVILKECSVQEIEKAILDLLSRSNESLTQEISVLQQNAFTTFSRETFTASYDKILENILKN